MLLKTFPIAKGFMPVFQTVKKAQFGVPFTALGKLKVFDRSQIILKGF